MASCSHLTFNFRLIQGMLFICGGLFRLATKLYFEYKSQPCVAHVCRKKAAQVGTEFTCNNFHSNIDAAFATPSRPTIKSSAVVGCVLFWVKL